ncbi:hypothetical protein Cgig2_018617 [Carnegiea gigantea]|uniref:RecQ mediated genome instability protein 1 OB-fold domain-containing protein n=1 Tax=Carnegiea gigantea TaxID=171969 RepID=A0A9Q1KDW3_9CARY|nr:hypothetical protein Cgig2_018617 [Carnegiea gigantea]
MAVSSSTEELLKSLTSRGWCFSDLDQVRAIITINAALSGESSAIDAVESELCNVDLRSIGGKSLPDASLLRKPSYVLQPPKRRKSQGFGYLYENGMILFVVFFGDYMQIASVRDISRSSMADGGRSSGNRRLLKMVLSDGQSEVSAVEYCYIPSISDNVVPGTKSSLTPWQVRLERKVAVHYGIVCLSPDVITVLGGLVQSLYEEWQMNQKYAGFSRSSLRIGRDGDADGPPPFEKLQIGGRKDAFTRNAPQSSGPAVGKSATKEGEVQQLDRMQASAKTDADDNSSKTASSSQRPEEKPTSSSQRPEEKPTTSESRPLSLLVLADYVPIQNQAAAQKLKQKLNNPTHHNERHRGQRYRGKGKEEEKPVFTLDEWERKKIGGHPVAREQHPDLSRDEELAWRLQNQFDLEDQVSVLISLF